MPNYKYLLMLLFFETSEEKTSVEHEIINTVLPEQIAQLVHLLHYRLSHGLSEQEESFLKRYQAQHMGKRGLFPSTECFQVLYFNQLHCSAWMLKLFLDKNLRKKIKITTPFFPVLTDN